MGGGYVVGAEEGAVGHFSGGGSGRRVRGEGEGVEGEVWEVGWNITSAAVFFRPESPSGNAEHYVTHPRRSSNFVDNKAVHAKAISGSLRIRDVSIRRIDVYY